MKFWHKTYLNRVKVGRKLFPDRPKGYSRTTQMLGNFASNLGTAMTCRLAGDIRCAQTYEQIADHIYNRLPKYAKDIADGLGNYDKTIGA